MRRLIQIIRKIYVTDVDGLSWRIKQLLDHVSHRFGRIAIMLLLAVVLSQIVLQNDFIRLWITGIDRWEGTALE